jgi:predicted metal-dependent enzyme (double-stranded beta helix superfamily)
MSLATEQRKIEVSKFLKNVRSLAGPVEVSRSNIEKIKDSLVTMASKKELWCEDEFPAPTGDSVQTRYLISQDDDDSYALYLNVMHTGKTSPPHNHTTWACIAAAEGEEYNYLFSSEDEGPLVPGVRKINPSETIIVKPGQGIGLLQDDIHSIAINEGESTRHLHLYGRGLETLTKRLMWDKELTSCKYFVMDVKTTK